jgi:PAS domain S-box-containing protein
MNTVLDGLIIIDHKGAIQSFNPSAERIFGYAAGEVIGKNVRMLMPEPYHCGHDGYLKNYLDTGDKKVIGIGREVSGRRKDGSDFPMELGVNEMQLAGERMFVGTVRDITERKQAEKEIRQHLAALKHSNQELALSEERYEMAVLGMSVGLWDWNIQTNELYWSKQFKDMLGIDALDIKPCYNEFADRLHPDDKDATLKSFSATWSIIRLIVRNAGCGATTETMYGFMPAGRRNGMRPASRFAWWAPQTISASAKNWR